MSINVGIVGVGNCACSLYQGLTYYKDNTHSSGLMSSDIGGYTTRDINVVAAFDIDTRKVDKTFKEAMFSLPNCTPCYCNYEDLPDGPIVQMGNVLDGVSEHVRNKENGFIVSKQDSCNIVDILLDKKVDILINYLPVGSQLATEFYANCCLETGVSFLNCIPVFIASNPIWEQKFIDAK